MPRTRFRFSFLFCVWLASLALVSASAYAADPPKTRGPKDGVIPPRIVLKTQVAPIFPPAAQAARFSGVVTIGVVIDVEGVVTKAHAVGSTHPSVGFEEAAIAAVEQWRFEPATLNGDPVPFETTYRLTFDRRGTGVIQNASLASGAPIDGTAGRWRSLDGEGGQLGDRNRVTSRNPGATQNPSVPTRR